MLFLATSRRVPILTDGSSPFAINWYSVDRPMLMRRAASGTEYRMRSGSIGGSLYGILDHLHQRLAWNEHTAPQAKTRYLARLD